MRIVFFSSLLFSWMASVALAEQPGAVPFSLKDSAGAHLDFVRGEKILARWMYAHDTSSKERVEETYKPYLHIFDADGKSPITKGPRGKFPHHRGIYLGWNRIGVGGATYDRWHMTGGYQVQQKLLAQSTDGGKASITAHILWAGASPEKTILDEKRTTTLFTPTHGYVGADVISVLKAVAGETKLEGDPEHAGLQFRPAQEVSRNETSYIYPILNANPHKDLDYPWVVETFTLEEKKYSVIFLNHPSNPQGTLCSAYRDYGRFGYFFKATIPAEKELTLKVRLLVVEGPAPEVADIQKISNEFTGRNDPAPTATTKPAEGIKK